MSRVSSSRRVGVCVATVAMLYLLLSYFLFLFLISTLFGNLSSIDARFTH